MLAFDEDRRRCLDEGMDGYLAKPFERDALIALIDAWCGPDDRRRRDGALTDVAA